MYGGKLKQMFAHRDKKWRGKFISTGTNSNGPVQLLRGQGRAVLVAGRAECAFSKTAGASTSLFAAAKGSADAIKNRFPSDVFFFFHCCCKLIRQRRHGRENRKEHYALFVGHSQTPLLPVCNIPHRSGRPPPGRR